MERARDADAPRGVEVTVEAHAEPWPPALLGRLTAPAAVRLARTVGNNAFSRMLARLPVEQREDAKKKLRERWKLWIDFILRARDFLGELGAELRANDAERLARELEFTAVRAGSFEEADASFGAWLHGQVLTIIATHATEVVGSKEWSYWDGPNVLLGLLPGPEGVRGKRKRERETRSSEERKEREPKSAKGRAAEGAKDLGERKEAEYYAGRVEEWLSALMAISEDAVLRAQLDEELIAVDETTTVEASRTGAGRLRGRTRPTSKGEDLLARAPNFGKLTSAEFFFLVENWEAIEATKIVLAESPEEGEIVTMALERAVKAIRGRQISQLGAYREESAWIPGVSGVGSAEQAELMRVGSLVPALRPRRRARRDRRGARFLGDLRLLHRADADEGREGDDRDRKEEAHRARATGQAGRGRPDQRGLQAVHRGGFEAAQCEARRRVPAPRRFPPGAARPARARVGGDGRADRSGRPSGGARQPIAPVARAIRGRGVREGREGREGRGEAGDRLGGGRRARGRGARLLPALGRECRHGASATRRRRGEGRVPHARDRRRAAAPRTRTPADPAPGRGPRNRGELRHGRVRDRVPLAGRQPGSGHPGPPRRAPDDERSCGSGGDRAERLRQPPWRLLPLLTRRGGRAPRAALRPLGRPQDAFGRRRSPGAWPISPRR